MSESNRLSTNQQQLVSYVIPAYNAAPYLAEVLESCLAQDYRPIEVVIVDDGSVDDTLRIATEFANKHTRDDFVVSCHHQEHSGVSVARNTGMGLVHGSIIGFVDADDIMPSRRTSRMVRTLEAENADVVYGGCARFRDADQLRRIQEAGSEPEGIVGVTIAPIVKFVPGVCGFLARREVLNQTGQFLKELSIGEDIEYIVRLRCLFPKMIRVSGEVYYYRVTPDSASSGKGRTRALNLLRTSQAIAQTLRDAGVSEPESWERVAHRSWQAAKASLALGMRGETIAASTLAAETATGIRRAVYGTASLLFRVPGVVAALGTIIQVREIAPPWLTTRNGLAKPHH